MMSIVGFEVFFVEDEIETTLLSLSKSVVDGRRKKRKAEERR